MGLVERDSKEDELPNELKLGLLDTELIVVEVGDKTGEPVYVRDCVGPGVWDGCCVEVGGELSE